MQHELSESTELNCVAFRSRLDAVLDSRRSPQLDLPLRAHAKRCQTCAEWLATQTAVLEVVESAPAIGPATDFGLQTLQTLQVGRQQQRRRRRRLIGSIAVAASLLVAVTAWREPAQERVVDVGATTPSASTKIPAAVLKRVDEVSQDFKPVSGSVYTALNAIWLAQRLL
jgi:hypothetical protein